MVKKTKKIIKDIIKRSPVVVVLGHVDHGKTSILDVIRKDYSKAAPGGGEPRPVAGRESGGITQHIGAYEVVHNEKKITFIDTPGHEAFSAMRARGTSVADIALLVVDAAQSVQPQTKEAVIAIKKAGIPMIVVLNKIDIPTADPQKIKRELSTIDVLVESMGGQIPSVEVSAREKKGIDELLEIITLVSDMQELVLDIDSLVEGIVIESYMDSLKGPVATVIVQKGILKIKDIIATDLAMAKIKSLQDFQGKEIKEAYPSCPAIILGFTTVPGVGEKFKTYASEKEALEKLKIESQKREINYNVLDINSTKKVVNVILKGDVFGSLEAIDGMLKNLPQDQVTLRILKAEVGDINESDAKLAEMSNAQIIGFRVKINPGVLQLLKNDEKKKVRIKTFEVIYELIQEARNGMERSLEVEVTRKDVGKLKTLLVFWAEKNRQIVGGKITEGEFKKGLKVDIFREDPSTGSGQVTKIGSGRIINLQRDKKDIEKLKKGDEAGILFEGNVKIEKGDIVVAWVEERQKGVL
ncbi:MAG: translation initiation factor IF-2 [Candidatus Staskawiczbacteria bacterium RIFCSPHIGHO2_02_FULL_34_10]|uniref:Translation initiation factor IF-2 n=2 Tax=Candidatus Staskawicziibacteriota TaxID=1817916 RepID=A0A1G2HLZ1_9BACT|nr:MAG: translation initiation factor IF-2 [Candidatus Staskawiczbacteria bacterium RIFCSPHIGHO2_01_FULL_34_27]OGZ66238.1 MAG: translation initiation factor IF-2 [Candidatus Staskawiczbacteria bacterium RIFCSPHIGHO2_02_FULL_34_10]